MPVTTLLILVLCNVIWSAHPVMGKLVLTDFPPAQGAWLRYASALAAYLLAILVWPWIASRSAGFPPSRRTVFLLRAPARDWAWLVLMGFMTFCFSPLLQMTGLSESRATDNSLIVAMEPLLSVLLAWILLKEKLHLFHLGAFVVALTGFFLLAGVSWDQLVKGFDPHLLGNLLLLLSLMGEAAFSVLGRKLVGRRLSPPALFGATLATGVLLLSVIALPGWGWPDVHHLSWRSALGLLWLGPLGTTFSYFLWMLALVRAPVASVAITLFIQPLMGAAWGYLFLGDRMSGYQLLGAALILAAVFGQTWGEWSLHGGSAAPSHPSGP
jgi:drug/metabolite transporter (DMT)-like permease